jgi:ribosome maturation factor RimP
MIDKAFVKEIVEEYLKDSDSYLIDVSVLPNNKITVEIDSNQSISIEDCILLNKYIESKLDREIEDYELEVGSVGISQPFKVLRQYKKNIGKEVEVLQKNGKKYAGVLKGADEEKIILTVEKQIKPEGAKRKITVEEDLPFDYNEIKYTKNIIRFK